MELSKNLANRYFSSSDYYNLSRLLGNTPEEKEKIEGLYKQIDSVIISCFDKFVDKEFLETFQKFPKSFQSTTRFYLSLFDLGITGKSGENYSEDGGKTNRSYRVSITLSSPFPTNQYSFDLDATYLKKMPEDKLELLKGWVSEVVHLEWLGTKREEDFKREYHSGNIKTFGKLYRMNKNWYELIVRSEFKDEILYSEEEQAKEQEAHVDAFIQSLNDLKPILDL